MAHVDWVLQRVRETIDLVQQQEAEITELRNEALRTERSNRFAMEKVTQQSYRLREKNNKLETEQISLLHHIVLLEDQIGKMAKEMHEMRIEKEKQEKQRTEKPENDNAGKDNQ